MWSFGKIRRLKLIAQVVQGTNQALEGRTAIPRFQDGRFVVSRESCYFGVGSMAYMPVMSFMFFRILSSMRDTRSGTYSPSLSLLLSLNISQ